MDSSDEEFCSTARVASRGGGRKRRSMPSHSCGGWHVDTESLTADMLEDVGLALMEDTSSVLPTPPNSQLEPASTAGEWGRVLDPYSTSLEKYIPGDFLVYKRQKLWNPEGYDPFCRLSNEVMLKLFSLMPKYSLTRCARVCRRWRHLALEESLWRRVDGAGRTFPAGVLGRLLQRGVRSLRLARAEISAPIFCDVLSAMEEPVCPAMLQHLDLTMVAISPRGVEQLLSACRRLEKLSLERCDLTETACASIGQNSRLAVLNCALATGISQPALWSILDGCRSLEELNLAWTGLDCQTLTALVTHIPLSVTKLNISGTKDCLKDAHIVKLVRRLGRVLRVLDVSDASDIEAVAYDAMMHQLECIEHLSLSRCYQLPGIKCTDLGRLHSLVCLDMFGCFTDKGVETLKRALPGLQINSRPFSTVARPTVGIRRTSIWELSVN